VLFWFAGLAVVIVWKVFGDTAIDYRLIMAGALAPDLVDALAGGLGVLHTVTSSAVLLAVVMVATRGRRGLRRRFLAVPVGTFLHLVLDGAWTNAPLFWWPVLGTPLPGGVPLSFHRPLVVLLVQEVAGVMALVWWWRRFRLHEPERRRIFLRTGRLGRDLVA
jgi:uncharacterized membrane protein YpjA